MSNLSKKSVVLDKFRVDSGVLRVARGGCGAKAPPLAVRPDDTTPQFGSFLDYRVVPGSRNWQAETALEFLPVSCTIFRNLLAGIWGSFLRFIKTGFRNWLAAFLDFPVIFL